MDDQNIQQDSNTEGMTKGKSAKGMSKGKTKAKSVVAKELFWVQSQAT